MTFRIALSAAFLLAVMAFPAAATAVKHGHAQPQPSAQPLPPRSDTQVYLMRGLFGVFSMGMDDLAAKLKALGYPSTIYSWDSWPQVASAAIKQYRGNDPAVIVIIGHSLGANSVFSVANQLNGQNVPIQLAVTFDATEPGRVPNNVSVFYNFWANVGFGRPVSAVPGYSGDLENFDLSGRPGIDHTTIDATDKFHQFVIQRLEQMTSD